MRAAPTSPIAADTSPTACSGTELLIAVIARLLAGCRHVAVGQSSPIPGSGALLARRLSSGALRVSVLGSRRNNFFTDGSVELFDLAAQGRIDAFFLGGGQIDGHGNINLVGTKSNLDSSGGNLARSGGDLVGTGSNPGSPGGGHSEVRWPGSFGSAYLYFLVPRVILFREEHTRRVMVPKVEFVSAPGVSRPNVYRPGGPHALLTGLGLFAFDKQRQRFKLESVHPGHSVEEILDNTGFEFDRPPVVPHTVQPDAAALALIRGDIREEIAEVYPRFAAALESA
jgi:glutaconate CoA-transferase subunit B